VRTAIDTNVFSAIWSAEKSVVLLLVQLEKARREGALLVSPFVFAELHAYPGATKGFIGEFLSATGVEVDWKLEQRLWAESAERFAHYATRRRRSSGVEPRRLLADFLIGAHALLQADRLLTLDPEIYQRDFPELAMF